MKTIIVAGITRSGLTLTMQMLYRGGYPCNGTWPAFEDNCFGVKEGMANKLVDTHHVFPKTGEYHVILLRRDKIQQGKAITKFIKKICGLPVDKKQTKALEKSIKPDWDKIHEWAKRQKSHIVIDFEYLIDHKHEAAVDIANFVGSGLNTQSMSAAVLNRSSECTDFLYETLFV